jgi:hypothetical protein
VPSFPALDPSKGSRFEPREPRVVDFAGDGTARIRTLHADGKGTFRLKFELDAADRATLMNFFAANPTSTFDFTWIEDGATYQVRFARAPVITPGEVEHRDVDVDLVVMS